MKSRRGVEFRRWASGVLRSYIVEGRAENARRLEQLAQVAAVMARIPESLETRQVLDIVHAHGRRDRRPLQVGAVYSKLPNLVIGFHGCEREVFDLGHCLNLTDSFHIDLLENEYELLAADAGYPVP